MSITVCCDVCLRKLPAGDLRATNHFCDRCLPFAEEYLREAQRIFSDGMSATSKSIEKFRANFLQQKILQSRKELKAV